ncbi:MAG: DUF5684 domain-containing protein [Lachnospiraceae bacterium]|nr:DUF5684 domain-containing protein [Lachnospiraceae bacterium]
MTTLLTAGLTVAAYALETAGKWKVLEKMNEEGWKALIPVYSEYLIFKNVYSVKAFWISLFASIYALGAAEILKQINIEAMAVTFLPVLLLVCLTQIAVALVAVVIDLKVLYKLAKAFGHGMGYTIGLIIAEPLFACILGFGKSEYEAA